MCILQPCAKPTQEGVWWRDDTQWRLYGANHQAVIRTGLAKQLKQIDLGTITSKVHPEGARYIVNLQAMKQVAVKSGQKRPVTVIDNVTVQSVEEKDLPQAAKFSNNLDSSVCPRCEKTLLPRRSATNLYLHLHYRDSDGNLARYVSDIEKALLEAMGSGRQHTLLMPDGGSGYYFFDFEAMEQLFVSHLINGRLVFSAKAPLQIIAEVPWDVTAMVSIAVKADKRLRRKILGMVVERFRRKEHLYAVLPMKACPRKLVSKSSRTCSVALYEKFVDSVANVLERFPGDVVGDLMSSAGTKEIGGGPLQIAFKPVNRAIGNFTNCNSVDESEKCKAAFWTSMAAPVAAAHAVVYGCAVQLKILAYLVILPISAWRKCAQTMSDECSGYFEVDSPEHGLPLAEVIVR